MTAPDITALCDAYEYSRLAVAHANDHADTAISDMQELRAENERLRTIIDNLHAVEEKHRETANAEFHRANRLQVENERLREALTHGLSFAESWVDEHGGIDGCEMQDRIRLDKIRAALVGGRGR